MADLNLSETELDDIILNFKGWDTWTPTVDNGGSSGPPTVTQNSNFYTVIGNICYVYLDHTITNSNGALGDYTFTAPVTPAIPNLQVAFYGREYNTTGKVIYARWDSANSVFRMLRHDSVNPVVTGHRFRLVGSYRIA